MVPLDAGLLGTGLGTHALTPTVTTLTAGIRRVLHFVTHAAFAVYGVRVLFSQNIYSMTSEPRVEQVGRTTQTASRVRIFARTRNLAHGVSVSFGAAFLFLYSNRRSALWV